MLSIMLVAGHLILLVFNGIQVNTYKSIYGIIIYSLTQLTCHYELTLYSCTLVLTLLFFSVFSDYLYQLNIAVNDLNLQLRKSTISQRTWSLLLRNGFLNLRRRSIFVPNIVFFPARKFHLGCQINANFPCSK